MIEVVIEDLRWSKSASDIEEVVREAAALALGAKLRTDDVVILLSEDLTVQGLCARYRGENRPTNVIAFPSANGLGAGLGDIALAFGVCSREAAEEGKSLTDHTRHLVIHGVLHLLGFDHERASEAATMEAMEVELLAQLGVGDPYEERCEADEHVATRR